jgi:hypothetical protein
MSREIAVAALVIGVLIIGGADNPNYTKCHDAGVGKGLRGNELSQFELQCLGFQPMTVSVSEAVPAGAKDHLIGVWYSANADCSSKGLPTVRVTGAPRPRHGQSTNGEQFAKFAVRTRRMHPEHRSSLYASTWFC